MWRCLQLGQLLPTFYNSSEMAATLLDHSSDIPRNADPSLRCRLGSTQTPKKPFPEDKLHPLPQPDIYSALLSCTVWVI